ncbi:MAG: phosphodiester glycosidase family protein [Candidatus Gastranaerophilales bacterium]|nr:phosphodiester glycosidase family protein [Candidatus Gastranaerophilales bacterium]
MDTLTALPKYLSRLIVNTLNVSIIMGLLFSQHIFEGPPILAQEQFTIANGVIVSPVLNGLNLEKNIREKISIEEQTKNFDAEVKKKYKNGIIIDVDKGVKHIKLIKYYQKQPVRINIVEVNTNLNPDLELTPALASETLGKKSTITTIAKKNNSIVAINGTFFKPSTGVPLGTLMINKKMYTGPIYDRVSMGIFKDGYDMARIQLNASLKSHDKILKIDNINQPRMLSTYVIVYTPEWGKLAPPSPKYGKQIAVSNNKILYSSTSQLEIPQDGFVVVGPTQKLEQFVNEKNIKLEVLTKPEWYDVNHIISGGPYLVKNSEVYVDATEEKLGSIGGRNPRTAVGYTPDNHLIIVTVDGREKASIGMTLTELAYFMKSIGCYNAMNLDGGGSTVLYVNGKVVNHPQVQGGIALSNALTLNKTNNSQVTANSSQF